MKIVIRPSPGAEIRFEGDGSEFEIFTSFLNSPPAFIGLLEEAAVKADSLTIGPEDRSRAIPASIDPHDLGTRIIKANATTDIEVVTLMAQAAVEAGQPGITHALAEDLFVQLGKRKPANIRQTFANAKRRKFVMSVGPGTWKPTVTGENFARGLTTRGTPGRRGARGTKVVHVDELPGGQ